MTPTITDIHALDPSSSPEESLNQGATTLVAPPRLTPGDFLEVIYRILFQPNDLYEAVAAWSEQPNAAQAARCHGWFLLALVLVTVVALAYPLAAEIGTGLSTGGLSRLLVNALFHLPLVLVLWGLESLLIAVLGYIFTGRMRYMALLTVTGFAAAPWLLLAPGRLLIAGLPVDVQAPIATTLVMVPLTLWSIGLAYGGVAKVYHMNVPRLLGLLLLPLLLLGLGGLWLINAVWTITAWLFL